MAPGAGWKPEPSRFSGSIRDGEITGISLQRCDKSFQKLSKPKKKKKARLDDTKPQEEEEKLRPMKSRKEGLLLGQREQPWG